MATLRPAVVDGSRGVSVQKVRQVAVHVYDVLHRESGKVDNEGRLNWVARGVMEAMRHGQSISVEEREHPVRVGGLTAPIYLTVTWPDDAQGTCACSVYGTWSHDVLLKCCCLVMEGLRSGCALNSA